MGGFEIRNPYFQGSSSPKVITTFDNWANEAVVFEGFTDFLSEVSTGTNRFGFVVRMFHIVNGTLKVPKRI